MRELFSRSSAQIHSLGRAIQNKYLGQSSDWPFRFPETHGYNFGYKLAAVKRSRLRYPARIARCFRVLSGCWVVARQVGWGKKTGGVELPTFDQEAWHPGALSLNFPVVDARQIGFRRTLPEGLFALNATC